MTQMAAVFCQQCGSPTGQFYERGTVSPVGYCNPCNSLAPRPDLAPAAEPLLPCDHCGETALSIIYGATENRHGRIVAEDGQRWLMIGDAYDGETGDMLAINCYGCGRRRNVEYDDQEWE